jgi:hypothetical protein
VSIKEARMKSTQLEVGTSYMLLRRIYIFLLNTHKAYVEVGEKNKHLTKVNFLSCLKVQI